MTITSGLAQLHHHHHRLPETHLRHQLFIY